MNDASDASLRRAAIRLVRSKGTQEHDIAMKALMEIAVLIESKYNPTLCVVCGAKPSGLSRYDTKYCSYACRQKAYRRRNKEREDRRVK